MRTPTEPYADIISTRDYQLRKRVERLATLEDRKMAQMARILLRRVVDEVEKERGLPPIEEEAA
ncbi:hypothetical protein [Vibrio sp. ER1A]|uniref:hypothetical protein n=1 Tax=Vibrio sp. ER1A TaxID=1517681 RepID=UPI0004DCF28D|nr:hypothetical protein [Vibrio sp. ER1A]KFA98766.1 hypothetical protein HW45_07000 [Vibrio sp. ER1A]